MKLYSYWQSSASWRVRLALALKGLDYDYHPINLPQGEQRQDSYLERNPQGLVPALELDDGTVLNQSLAIIQYLEKAYPQMPLYPSDPVQAARAQAIAVMVACEAQPLSANRMNAYLRNDIGLDDNGVSAWLERWVTHTLNAVEKLMPPDGAFFTDGKPGLPEIFIIPQLYAARRFGAPIGHLESLLALEAKCELLPTFKAAHAFNQIDRPRS